MKKMLESEFNKIKPTCNENSCSHNDIIKLIVDDIGVHSDYGCKACKATHFNLEDFKR